MSFPRYPKYKDSGVEWLGEVPEGWKITRVKHVINFITGWTPPTGDTSSFEGDNLWANISDLGAKTIYDTAKRISDEAVAKTRIKPAREGSLLFSFKLSIGLASFAGRDMYTNEAIATFAPSKDISLDYAYYAFPEFIVRNAAENIYGAKLLNQELIRSAMLVIPQRRDQDSIAAFLDRETAKIDALVAEQENLIALLKEKRQAVISHAVTKGLDPTVPMKDSGIEWLGEVPAHWDVKRIKHLCTIISKGTTPTTVGAEFTSNGVRFLKAENITETGVSMEPEFFISEDAHTTLSRSSLAEGDVLVVIAGATTGKSAVLGSDFIPANTNQAVSFARPNDIRMSQFMTLWLGTSLIKNLILLDSVQSAQPNLSMEDLGNIPIPQPSLHEIGDIQNFVRTETAKLDDLTTEAQHTIDLLKERRSALISAAVTGKIDVRGYHVHSQPIT